MSFVPGFVLCSSAFCLFHIFFNTYIILQKLDTAISKLGSEPIHSPVLLGCSILQYIASDVEQGAGEVGPSKVLNRAHRMGNSALQLGVFNVLLDLLETEPFSGTEVCDCMPASLFKIWVKNKSDSIWIYIFQNFNLFSIYYSFYFTSLVWDCCSFWLHPFP